MWIHGLFTWDSFSDQQVFRTYLKIMLQENKTAIAEQRCKGESSEYLPSDIRMTHTKRVFQKSSKSKLQYFEEF